MSAELEAILRAHAVRYPLMEPTDAVKLIFQNEFGGGHLITDPAATLRYLQREYSATPRDPALPLTEDIGNGIVRVQLAALDANAFPLERLNELFVRSAEEHKGETACFVQKLKVLQALTEQRVFAFSPGELWDYLARYRDAGYPPVSHSARYRGAYRPAYRVVKKDLL